MAQPSLLFQVAEGPGDREGCSRKRENKFWRWVLRRKVILISLSIAALLTTFALPMPAIAVPRPPHVFRGTVTVGGSPAQDGLTVTATIAGATFPYTLSETTSGGRYGGTANNPTFKVPADDSDTPAKEGGVDGNTVVFYVQGVQAGTAIFVSNN